MLTETAADAVFIARGTYGNPWVFGDARAPVSYTHLDIYLLSKKIIGDAGYGEYYGHGLGHGVGLSLIHI